MSFDHLRRMREKVEERKSKLQASSLHTPAESWEAYQRLVGEYVALDSLEGMIEQIVEEDRAIEKD